MKKYVKILALALVLVLALSMTAFATAGEADSNPVIRDVIEGATIVFTDDTYAKLNVTYTGVKPGKEYIIWVVEGVEVTENGVTETVYIPNENTIQYIGQKTSSGTSTGIFEFENVYPNAIVDSAVMISGEGTNGLLTLAIIDVPYLLGDVDRNNFVDSNDALAILKHGANIQKLDALGMALGDVDANNSVDSNDALFILQLRANIIDKLPADR